MTHDQKRVYLWAVPRSISSSFFRAMSNAVDTKGIFEPYGQAYHFGSERVSPRYSDEPPKQGSTFMDIKTQLEGPHPGMRVVFAKDVANVVMGGPLPLLEILPSGYTHTFLIRNPLKSVPSFYKISIDKEGSGWNYFDPEEVGFKDLYEIYINVTQNLGQEPIILDADDLLVYPEDMMRQYCDKTGLQYQRVMLHWDEALPEKLDAFNEWPQGWFRTMLANKTFNRAASRPIEDISLHPEAVQQAIRDSQPYYEKLYKLRLMPKGS